MRSFLRNIWKSKPANQRPPWPVFCEKVRNGEIQVLRKKDVIDKALATKQEKDNDNA